MNIDYDFVKDNIEEFIDVYFQFNPANLDREKQYRNRWYNTIGKSSPTSKDQTKIADQTILYIQEIIKLRKEKAVDKKIKKNNHIIALEEKINYLKQYEEQSNNWRFVTQFLKNQLLKHINGFQYQELIHEELEKINISYFGL